MTDDNPFPEAHQRRPIRSFVLRTGRMTPSQQRAYDSEWPKWGLVQADGMIDPHAVFERDAPRVLEIGFGMGDSLAHMAAHASDKDFIGVEVHTPGVGRLLSLIEQDALTNLRIYRDDAVEILDRCVPDGSLSRVQIYFPDPWHKKKHNKRRIVQPEFVQKLRTKLAVGGVIHLATDWENYAEHMMDVMSSAEGFTNVCGEKQFSPRPEERPITKFERRGQSLGHGVWDLLFEKTAD
ncbi:tRNA (guanine-N(7)-)-methyltransferase [BD1-7 clade bacterium]|uniref:tRNA (guanine-N(7)-)-methyltransferase n=1 Tax=BD1-7 clade bacterium TaxID=2029982 RepID=A0A5S9QCR4_9GAMM|nr:tRNA (guanine-N(7)-)-methyltransferase [BD1-7 clade bacterium]